MNFCRLHLAKFESAVLGLLLAVRDAVNHHAAHTVAHILSVLQLNRPPFPHFPLLIPWPGSERAAH
jgi:hypothetical protein